MFPKKQEWPFTSDPDPFTPIPSSTILSTLDSELTEHVEEVVVYGFLSFYTTLFALYNRERPLDGHKTNQNNKFMCSSLFLSKSIKSSHIYLPK